MNSFKKKIEVTEREEITRCLEQSNWIMARAAKQLGITVRMIGYKIKKYGIGKGGYLQNEWLDRSGRNECLE